MSQHGHLLFLSVCCPKQASLTFSMYTTLFQHCAFFYTHLHKLVIIFSYNGDTSNFLPCTTLGSYLLSGGEEGVLVLWQLQTSHQQFRPRLGSAITSVSCSPNDSYFTVSLANNGISIASPQAFLDPFLEFGRQKKKKEGRRRPELYRAMAAVAFHLCLCM